MCESDIIVEPLAKRRQVIDWNNIKDIFAAEDTIMAKKVSDAKSRNCTLRYVQRITCDPPAELGNEKNIKAIASIQLEEVPLDSNHALVKVIIVVVAFF